MDITNSIKGSLPGSDGTFITGVPNKVMSKTVDSSSVKTVDSADKKTAGPQKATSQTQEISQKGGADNILKDLNHELQAAGSYLQFEKSDDSNKMIFLIKNSKTDEVIRQIPSKDLLAISKNITDYLKTVQKPDSLTGNQLPVGLITSQKA